MSTLPMERGKMTTQTRYDLVTLNPCLPNRVHVVDEQRRRVVMTMEQAVRACHAYEKQILFRDQFDALLSHLAGWWFKRADKVSRAIVTVRESGLLLVLVQSQVELDIQLEADITELVSDVINDSRFELIRLDALSLPACELDDVTSFADPSHTLELAIENAQ